MYRKDEAFNVLGIEPTTDKKRIKKAYARRVKDVHPEENPEGWKELHDAYEAAIWYADGHDWGKRNIIHADQLAETAAADGDSGIGALGALEQHEKKIDEDLAEANRVESFDDFFETMKDSESYDLMIAKNRLTRLFAYNHLKRKDISEGFHMKEQWIQFFDSGEFQRLYREKAFWDVFRDVVLGKQVDYQVGETIKNKLEEIQQLEGEDALHEDARQLVDDLKIMYWKYIEKEWGYTQEEKTERPYVQSKKRWSPILRFVVSVALLFAIYVVEMNVDLNKDKNMSDLPDVISEQYDSQEKVFSAMADYLNEKYGEDRYCETSFVEYGNRAFAKTSAEYYSGIIHRAFLAEEPEKMICIVEYQDGEKPQCYDNLQGDEITAALEEYFISQGIINDGRVILRESAIEQILGDEDQRGIIAPVYHNKFDGNMEVFFAKESMLRNTWLEPEKPRVTPIDTESFGSRKGLSYKRYYFGFLEDWKVLNGRISVYTSLPASKADDSTYTPLSAADDSILGMETIDSWLESDGSAKLQMNARQLNSLEKRYGIRVSIVNMPKVFYEYVKTADEMPWIDSVEVYEESSLEGGLTLPYGGSWYVWGQSVSSNTYFRDEGIYLLYFGYSDNKGTYHTTTELDLEKRQLKFKMTADEAQMVMIIFSEKDIGIEGDNISIELLDSTGQGTSMNCTDLEQYMQSGFAEQHNSALRIDGYIFVPYTTFNDRMMSELKEEILLKW